MPDHLSQALRGLLGNTALEDLPDEARALALDLMQRALDDGFESLEDLGGVADRAGGPPSAQAPRPWINLIPAPPGTPPGCAPIVLAIARQPLAGESAANAAQNARFSLAMILRWLREHLIHCGCGPRAIFNRTALVLTDHWDRRRAYESRLDLEEHTNTARLRYAMLHWDGRRWRRQWL